MFPYSTILGPVFWIIMGLLYAFLIYGARIWLQDLNVKMNWWKWLLISFWFIILNVSIAGGFTLIGENEGKAGIYFLLFFVSLSIILGVIVWRIITIGRKKNLNEEKKKS